MVNTPYIKNIGGKYVIFCSNGSKLTSSSSKRINCLQCPVAFDQEELLTLHLRIHDDTIKAELGTDESTSNLDFPQDDALNNDGCSENNMEESASHNCPSCGQRKSGCVPSVMI